MVIWGFLRTGLPPALHDSHPVAHEQSHEEPDDDHDAVVDGPTGGCGVVLHVSGALRLIARPWGYVSWWSVRWSISSIPSIPIPSIPIPSVPWAAQCRPNHRPSNSSCSSCPGHLRCAGATSLNRCRPVGLTTPSPAEPAASTKPTSSTAGLRVGEQGAKKKETENRCDGKLLQAQHDFYLYVHEQQDRWKNK